MKPMLFAIATLAGATLLSPVYAQSVSYHATLTGASEVPPTDSHGSGAFDATLDPSTKMLKYTVKYNNFAGKVTGGHIHGPAPAGQNGGVLVPFPAPLASPITGSVKLTQKEINDMNNGMTYVNLHTAKHPAGAIRGQIAKG